MGYLQRFLGIESRSIENPAIPLNSPEALAEVFGERQTDAGVAVSHLGALEYAPLWQCVTLISGDVAKLPCVIYKRTKARGRIEALTHPSYNVVRHQANEEQNAFDYWRSSMVHALLWQNSYSYISRDGAGRVLELIPLLPDRTGWGRLNGKLFYVTEVNGQLRRLAPDNVFHIKGFSTDGIAGVDLVHKARNSIALGLACEKFGSKFFANGARAGGVVTHPGKLKKAAAENLIKGIEDRHQGVDKSFRTMLLEEGAKFIQLTIPPDEGQFNETRDAQVLEMARRYNVPPHKLGIRGSASYNSLEQENQGYLDGCLVHWLVAISSEGRSKLLTEDEKRKNSHFVEHNTRALLRADTKTRAEVYRIYREIGVMTADQVAAAENMEPVAPEDDGLFIPSNWQRASQAGKEIPVEPDADVTDVEEQGRRQAAMQSLRGIVVDALRRMVKRFGHQADKAKSNPRAWIRSLDELAADNRSTFSEAIGPPVIAFETLRGCSPGATEPLVRDLLAKLHESLLAAADGSPDQFDQRVTETIGKNERELPEAFADRLIKKETHYVAAAA